MIRRDLYGFDGAIWNMLTDPEVCYFFLEIRNDAGHQVSFAAVDLENDRLLWKDLTFEEPWWIGATATDGNVLVFHIYQDTQNPQHKTYFAIDVATRQKIWQSDTFQVVAVKDGWLLGYEQQDDLRRYKLMAIRKKAEKSVSEAEAESLLGTGNKNLYYPFHYTETQPYFETIKQFIIQYMDTKPVRGCEYLEYKDLVMISYYIQEDQALANYLLVMDTEGRLSLQERLDHHLTQIGLGTFFIANNKLVLIKEKSQLISYAL